jgi:antitoxin CcdA
MELGGFGSKGFKGHLICTLQAHTIYKPKSKEKSMLRFDNTPKKTSNLSLKTRVMVASTTMGMNISQTVDELLADDVKQAKWQKWNEENKDAIDHYNARIRTEGLPLAQYRSF